MSFAENCLISINRILTHLISKPFVNCLIGSIVPVLPVFSTVIKARILCSLILSTVFTECGPGTYKGKKTAPNNYCSNEVDACLQCPGNEIKSVSGDSSSLCEDVCDGTTNVPNAARTACGE